MLTNTVKFAVFTAIGYVTQILAGLGIGYVLLMMQGILPFDVLTLDDFFNMLSVAASDNFIWFRLTVALFIALAAIKVYPTFGKSFLMTVFWNACAILIALVIAAIVA